MHPTYVTAARERSESPVAAVRAGAGCELARLATVAGVPPALHRLLLDEHAQVTRQTAEALLARGDTYGLSIVLKALTCAAREGTRKILHDLVLDRFYGKGPDAGWDFVMLVAESGMDDDNEVSDGAKQFLERVRF